MLRGTSFGGSLDDAGATELVVVVDVSSVDDMTNPYMAPAGFDLIVVPVRSNRIVSVAGPDR
jgi:hypothetical protein